MTDFLSDTDASRKALSRALRDVKRDGKPLAPSYCSMLALGDRRPGWDTAVLIERQLGIPVSFWATRRPTPKSKRKVGRPVKSQKAVKDCYEAGS